MKTKSKRSHFQCEFRTYKNGVLQYEDIDHRFTAVRLEDYIKRYQARFEKMGYTVEFKNVVNLDEEGTEFVSRIKETRIKYGLTQQQVSNLTGVPFRSIQNWETGIRKCPDYVTKMVISMIEQKFSVSDHQIFLEEFLEMLQSDVRFAKSEETKNYISNLITDVTEHLNK